MQQVSDRAWAVRREEWDKRVRQMGVGRAVYHMRHKTPEQLAAITKLQRDVIMPLFRNVVSPTDKLTLDFGCGVGRWTPELADITGTAIGVDPTASFLREAQKTRHAKNVMYLPYTDGRIPLLDGQADVVWSCMVLSTVVDDEMLMVTVNEIDRVLRQGGLMFLVDNTAGPAGHSVVRSRWSISRTIEEYQIAFKQVAPLHYLGEYKDFGEVNTVMAGRKA
jgi:SAM-dependent methyltransferase